jgi:tRNA dimethylallyltransferase
MNPTFVALVGPTASGKTDLAIDAAEASGVDVEVIVLDSRQLYRGLDAGTGKPDAEQRRRVPHHLLDCIGIDETPDARDYRRRVEAVAGKILARGAVPFLVGGAGFYLRALREGFHDIEYTAEELASIRDVNARLSNEELFERLRELDAASAGRLHPNDRYRIGRAIELYALSGRPASELEASFEPAPVLGASFEVTLLMPDRETLHRRIERRTGNWLDGEWVGEVETLLRAGHSPEEPGLQTLGYRQVVALVSGRRGRADTEEEIVVATRRYARAQRTWFRKEETAYSFTAADASAVDQIAALLRSAGGSP